MQYRKTIVACFIGYIVQAIVNNFVPLLFLTFHRTFSIPLSQITLLVTINFAIQLVVDLLAITFVDRIGYRASMVLAHALAAMGLVSLAVLPGALGNPFLGLLCAVMLYAIGGGLLEVLVSPIVEACPTRHKEQTMSLLHSFYCWGHVGVILLSTLFFVLVGTEHWPMLALLWALVPLINMFIFTRVPIARLDTADAPPAPLRTLVRSRVFWLLMVMMFCAGSSEQAVSQWASAFAEQGLGVSKTVGDLAGPLLFAASMGSARALYGKFGARLRLAPTMRASALLCIASYALISLAPWPALALAGCGLCGFSVGLFWPGTFSMAALSLRGGTTLFALLSLAGDLGCSGGPTVVGLLASAFGDRLSAGILGAAIFPVLLLVALLRPMGRGASLQQES